jgi:hypothetical protein
MAITRSVSSLSLGSDAYGKDAFLLPAAPYICRLEIAAATRQDFTVPAGTKRVIFQYDATSSVYVFLKKAGDDNLTTPSGDVTDGTAPFLNPVGLVDVDQGATLQFISASAAVVHVICAG